MSEEIWKDVKGFEGRYQVSNLGRVRSLDMTWLAYNWKMQGYMECKRKGRTLKPLSGTNGYLKCCLRDGKRKEYHNIHRLVALSFIPNPCNFPCINHKDENKANNFVFINSDGTVDFEKSNLEWCTYKYNSNYGTRNDRLRKYSLNYVMRPIIQYDMNGKVINTFESLTEAENKTGISNISITGVCKGRRKSTHGYVFKYLNTDVSKRKMSKGYNKPLIAHAETLRKKVIQYNLEGKVVNTFNSIREACDKTGINWSCIHGTLSGKRNHTYGYIFKFEGSNPPKNKVMIKRPIREVIQYDLYGNIINTFNTIAETSRKTGINTRCIQGTLRGKRKSTHGYVFKFKDNNQ